MTAMFTDITPSQRELIGILARKHGIDSETMDRYAEEHVGHPVAELSKRDASALIDRMLTWKAAPPEIAKLQGQLDLFDIGGAP